MAPTNVDLTNKPRENDELDEELRTLSYHRALAYDALTRNSRKMADSHQKKKRNDPRQARTYPPTSRSVSPAPTLNKASRQDVIEDKEVRGSSIIWQPQKPSYVLASRKSEIDISNNTNLTQSEYRPHSTPPKQRKGAQTRYGPINQSGSQRRPSLGEVHGTPMRQSAKNDDVRSELGGDIYPPTPQTTDPAIRNDVQPLHITEQLVQYYRNASYDDYSPGPIQESHINLTSTYAPESISRPSSITSTVSRGRRMSRARASSSTSTTCSSYCPSVTSTQKLTRPPSPSRGSWISDHPQQEQLSFRERASHQFSKGLHLNLRRAGIEPESSFIVHSVVKKSTDYVPASRATPAAPPSPLATPTPTPTSPTIPWEPPNTAVPFALELHNINSMLGASEDEDEVDTGGDKNKDTVDNDDATHSLQYIEKVEERMRRIRQQQRSLAEMRRAPAILGADAPSKSGKSSGSNKSLFLHDTRGTRPTSDSFFATEWSRQQAEELAAPLRLLNPFRLDPFDFDAEVSQPGSLSRASEAPRDDRIKLPSQSRRGSYHSLLVAGALTKSPEQMSPAETGTRPAERHLLKRKRGMTALR
ncbi:hypothetical protein F4813DRAFT_401298 [Daldinia decipiens]|uniref:uncharacterized protein n=1 Tax=Daldinia decipiens TaxID=326647 RepID=UPI0020C4A495|nr:uncharacterized protein F4813DRAFT_401298 [Daldinia decipiens]KAI1659687.1 hypothetical protein F4813DRAFT_401298 [Daldinia decipiens]